MLMCVPPLEWGGEGPGATATLLRSISWAGASLQPLLMHARQCESGARCWPAGAAVHAATRLVGVQVPGRAM